MASQKLQAAYDSLQLVTSPSESEGLKKPRSILLLWFLRHVMGIDDLEAYEFICDGDLDQGIDGLLIEPAPEPGNKDSLIIFQSKYTEGPTNVGVNDIKSFIGSSVPFRSIDGLDSFLQRSIEPELKSLIDRYNIHQRIIDRDIVLRLIFVTSGVLNGAAKSYLDQVNASDGAGAIRAYDLNALAPLVRAFRLPQTVTATAELDCGVDQRFTSMSSSGKVVIASVKASEIVEWPGIDDRTLFDLNIRRQLKRNNVRKALEIAVQRKPDHKNFIAFHNGLTVICREIDDSSSDKLVVKNISVANGAQSTLAFYDSKDYITPDLRVLVKFVEAEPEQQLARDVAARSNNQNPVTPRNLRARDGAQLRLEGEFASLYPEYTYETRPDAILSTTGDKTIQNDFAAQLLCAVYNRRPWLAIKRTSLFSPGVYPMIFSRDISADHIMLVYSIFQEVQNQRNRFPGLYVKSWQLTRLTACYIVGELLRADDEGSDLINNPSLYRTKNDTSLNIISNRVRFAAAAMAIRHNEHGTKDIVDDYKVDFKRESSLKALASTARTTYVTYKAVELD
jgi:hypothetical protein